MEREIVLSMQHIDKTFPGVKALSDVNIKLFKGEVLGICGENGAGKSTLLKILSGIYQVDSGGAIIYADQTRHFRSPCDAIQAGIRVIHQELSYLNDLSVAENIYQGRLPMHHGFVDWKRMYKEAEAYLKKYEIPISSKAIMRNLPLANKQLVEIIKAVSANAKIVVMDEPTSSLGPEEVKILMKIIRSVSLEGVSFIFVSHRLEELFEISDRIVVIRDGRTIREFTEQPYDQMQVVSMMVGRQLKQLYHKEKVELGNVVLQVEELCSEHLHNVSFTVHAGEILGIYGMAGSGQDEILNAIFGMVHGVTGNILLNGKRVKISSPKQAIRNGIAHVTAERKYNGLILVHSVAKNLVLTSFKRLSKGIFVNESRENEIASGWTRRLGIKTPSIETLVGSLSGGNQQKIVIGKWLQVNPKVLLLNEPTRGVDVGARQEIFDIVQEQCKNGMAVIMISSDMLEMLNMADRIYTVYNGKLTAQFIGEEKTPINLMLGSIDKYKGASK